MVVDPSVLLAVLLHEEGHEQIELRLESAWNIYLSSASYVELFVVVFRRLPPEAVGKVEALLHQQDIQIVPFDEAQASIAREAYRRFGKGRHPAALNFGDCFSYALAKHLNEPLLFKGEDFRQTDVLVA